MSCNRCYSSSCTCSSGSTLVPEPFYVQASVCKEDHTNYVHYNQYAYGLQIQSSWNIPQCGGAAVLSVPGAIAISVGSYIWHITYGYFKIISFDSVKKEISVENPCFSSNSPAGTEVPACSTFVVTPEPCCEDVGQSGVYLKYDFTAPADGDCIDITLTSVDGLISGNDVQIGSGVYGLSEIKANNVVTICNEGEGITAGTPVIAQNASGLYQYPIIQLSVNPCTQTNITEGKVIACSGDNMSPITGATVGHSIILQNVDGTAEYGDPLTPLASDTETATGTNATGTISGTATPLSANSNSTSITITNASSVKTQNILVVIDSYIVGQVSNASTEPGTLTLSLNVNTGGGSSVVRVLGRWVYSGTDTEFDYADQVTWHTVLTVAPSASVTVTAFGTILTGATAPGVGPDFTYSTFNTKISAIGVSV